MIKTLIALTLFATAALSQSTRLIDSFPAAFEKAIRPGFTDAQFEEFFSKYDSILDADDEVADSKPKPAMYPLYDFKRSKLYQANVDKLLTSPNKYHRLIAVKIIGASDDTAREGTLLRIIQSDEKPGIVFWAGMSLMEMKSRHTTELFEFLVKYEDLGDAHMFPFYVGLDPKLLQQTAYERIADSSEKAKILAAQSLSVAPLNPETERLLKQAVKEWNINIKGYAISSIAKLRIGNLLPLLTPLIDDPKTRAVSLAALANSPTASDREFVVQQVEAARTVSLDLLEALFRSENTDNLRVWLKALYTKDVERDYFIWENEQPLLLKDEILPDVQTALKKVTDPKKLSHLVELLRGRADNSSVDILIMLMNHKDDDVRYFAASVARDSPSPRLKDPAIQNTIKTLLRK